MTPDSVPMRAFHARLLSEPRPSIICGAANAHACLDPLVPRSTPHRTLHTAPRTAHCAVRRIPLPAYRTPHTTPRTPHTAHPTPYISPHLFSLHRPVACELGRWPQPRHFPLRAGLGRLPHVFSAALLFPIAFWGLRNPALPHAPCRRHGAVQRPAGAYEHHVLACLPSLDFVLIDSIERVNLFSSLTRRQCCDAALVCCPNDVAL